MISWFFLIVATLFNSIGNILIKVSSQSSNGTLLSPYLKLSFIIGVLFFGLNLLAYTKAQTQIPLSTAYSVLMGGTMIVISITGVLLFNEQITLVKFVGMVAILFGVYLLTS